ncbi:hypothetical protein LTR37_012784 [Vermiconidia calcicola]|uniref:Uncharacterized protein n=1 Tax=Vermiconidia calcicola TaxID=1690605 RepID=A0ACC3MZ09_9PEZI|nr:hypothetical protein LTR37_012784 [Vermiconidia calcicola]
MAAIDPSLSSDTANTNGNNQIPSISQAVPQQGPAMQTLQPQHPDQYRALPAPPQMYAPPYQQPPPMGYPPAQPAPRQRTAIACRYCRRRKIRCSGFDQSEDGRCTNCQRFSQECVFTPVSAQTQAFVPAHTVWRGQNPPTGTQLYGAYGQPLPQHGNRDPYPPPGPQQPGQYPPPPQGYQQPPMYQQPPPPQGGAGQKRSSDEPHTPTLPPPNPGAQAQMPQHRGSADGQQQFGYPDPSGLTPAGASPASSTHSFHSAAQPYYTQSAPSFDASRASSSPHKLGLPRSPAPPPTSSGLPQDHTPPGSALAANAQRQGAKIGELVGPGGQEQQQSQASQTASVKREERTSTDTKHGEPTNGATTATPDGATPRKEEVSSTKKNGVDAGVQTDPDNSIMAIREQAS